MGAFRVIELADGSEWACNKDGEGLFLKTKRGDWQQQRGTGQTPTFKTARALSRYVHANCRDRNGEKLPRMRSSYGWPS